MVGPGSIRSGYFPDRAVWIRHWGRVTQQIFGYFDPARAVGTDSNRPIQGRMAHDAVFYPWTYPEIAVAANPKRAGNENYVR